LAGYNSTVVVDIFLRIIKEINVMSGNENVMSIKTTMFGAVCNLGAAGAASRDEAGAIR